MTRFNLATVPVRLLLVVLARVLLTEKKRAPARVRGLSVWGERWWSG